MAMECDLDDDAKKDLKVLFDKKDNIKKELNDLEDNEWTSLNNIIKQKLTQSGRGNIKGYFSKEKRFYQIYLEESVKIYREIFKALTNLTKRLDFYVAEVFEA
jgi:spore coat protein CotH